VFLVHTTITRNPRKARLRPSPWNALWKETARVSLLVDDAGWWWWWRFHLMEFPSSEDVHVLAVQWATETQRSNIPEWLSFCVSVSVCVCGRYLAHIFHTFCPTVVRRRPLIKPKLIYRSVSGGRCDRVFPQPKIGRCVTHIFLASLEGPFVVLYNHIL
jgi:hypothetical protein